MLESGAGLIAVEGLAGSGKSTFSQALAVALTDSGTQARWYSELECEHPLGQAYKPDRDGSATEFVASTRAVWRRFVDQNAGFERSSVIVEAWLIQNQVFGLLLANEHEEVIVRSVGELLDALPVARTTVVRLTQRDVPSAVEHFCQTRGARMRAFYVRRNDESAFGTSRGVSGMAGLVRFWTEHQAICNAVLTNSDFRQLTADVSDHQWDRVTADLFEQLGLTQPAVHSTTDLERYTGAYLLDDATGSTFRVVMRDGSLTLLDFPYFWRDVPKHLVAHGTDTFLVRSWPAELTFELRAGKVVAVVVREQQRFGTPPWPGGSYRKVA